MGAVDRVRIESGVHMKHNIFSSLDSEAETPSCAVTLAGKTWREHPSGWLLSTAFLVLLPPRPTRHNMLPPTRTSQLHRLFFALVVLTLLLLLWTPTLLTSNSEPSPNDATSTPDLVFKLHEGAQTGIDRVKDGLRVLWKTATSDATGLEEHVNERWRNASILDATEGVALDEELSKSLNQVLLPLCNRSLLIRASGSRGFASEFNRILRLAAIGEHFGYEVFVESRMWVYGTFDE